jgi:membrane associated rhomboid family serine protease
VTQRYFVYPLAVLVLAQLAPLLRGPRRWFLAQVTQLSLILLTAIGALVFENDFRWVVIAWMMFCVFVVAPRLLTRVAAEHHHPALWQWAGGMTWGRLGRLFRRYARAEKLLRGGRIGEALTLMEAVLAEPMPEVARGDAQLFRLRLLLEAGDWDGAQRTYENVDTWGTLVTDLRARLLAARVYARAGNFERAFRCLQLVAQSPRTLGQIERQYRATRAEVFEQADGALPPVLQGLARDGLAAAEQSVADWRALLSWAKPAPATLVFVLICTITWLVDKFQFDGKLWVWAGNIPGSWSEGEWWRPLTALALHANWLHLTMNALALWMFGSAVERTLGRWRFVVIFLMAGTAANALSARFGHYDVSVGASGGIFGLIAAFAVCVYRLRAPLHMAVRRRLLLLLGLMLAVDLTIGGLEPQVDDLAHAAGFAAGLVLALALSKPRVRRVES